MHNTDSKLKLLLLRSYIIFTGWCRYSEGIPIISQMFSLLLCYFIGTDTNVLLQRYLQVHITLQRVHISSKFTT